MRKSKRENEFTNKVDNLIREFENSNNPKSRELAKHAKVMRQDQQKIARSITNLQESLDYLRICIKYQVFDLEATRRENEYLRQLLAEDGDRECTS